MTIKRWLPIVAAAVASGVASPAGAVLWAEPPASFADVVARADRAYRARVESLSYGSAPGPAGRSLPYTQVGLRVEFAYKGTSAGALESVFVLGGPLTGSGGRHLLVPGLPIFALGERVIVFANHASFPFAGGVWGSTGVLRVARVADGATYALTHAWHPLALAGATLAARVEVRCAPDTKQRGVCLGWFPASPPKPGSTPQPVPTPGGIATMAQLDEWIADRVRAGGAPPKPSLVTPAEVETLIGRWQHVTEAR